MKPFTTTYRSVRFKSGQLSKIQLDIRNFDNDFLLIRAAGSLPLHTIGQQIFEQQFDFIEEVILTETELCLKLNALFDDGKLALLQTFDEAHISAPKCYRLPIYFDEQEDWKGVMTATGLGKNEIIEKLSAIDFSVAMFGFLPGFIYLNGLPSSLHVARKAVPAKYVKANSVAIGGKYLGLYALDSPGGWHVIGRVPVAILQIPQLPPLPLKVGDRMRCCAISRTEFDELEAQQVHLITYNA